MYDFFLLLSSFWQAIIDTMNGYSFTIGNYDVTLSGILFAFLVVGIVISIFWKGGKA